MKRFIRFNSLAENSVGLLLHGSVSLIAVE